MRLYGFKAKNLLEKHSVLITISWDFPPCMRSRIHRKKEKILTESGVKTANGITKLITVTVGK